MTDDAPTTSRPWYRKKRWWALAVAVVLVIAIAAGGGDDDDAPETAATTANDGAASETTSAPTDRYAVGDTATTSDFEVTLHSVEDPFDPADGFSTPAEGHRYVAVELEVRNLADEQRTFSTLAYTEILDSTNRAWDVELTGTNRPTVEGDMPAGDARRGWVVFEVGDDAAELRLRVKGSITASGAIFVL